MYVAIEGCSCVGKSTLMKRIKRHMITYTDSNVEYVKFPRDMSDIRPDTITEDCLSDMNNYFDYHNEYELLISDRSIISTYVLAD
jgi:thymidylate kinase